MKKFLIRGVAIILLMIMVYFSISVNMIGYGTGEDIEEYNSMYSRLIIDEDAEDPPELEEPPQRYLIVVLSIAQIICVGSAIIMLIVLAIKCISAVLLGKAEIKKHMVVYVVGAIVLFAASSILEIIKRFAGMVKPAA